MNLQSDIKICRMNTFKCSKCIPPQEGALSLVVLEKNHVIGRVLRITFKA